jgi:hypothetical protein
VGAGNDSEVGVSSVMRRSNGDRCIVTLVGGPLVISGEDVLVAAGDRSCCRL